jgi:hypothetical protein
MTITTPLAATVRSSQMRTSLLALILTASCATEQKKLPPKTSVAPREAQITRISKAEGIDRRILLTAAYTQSNFGRPSDPDLAAKSTRASFYAMPIASTGPIDKNDVESNSKLLAARISEMAKADQPKDPFDWLVLAAHSIVGQATDDPNIRDLALRTVLVELIETYNNGFTTSAREGDDRELTITVSPLPEQQQIRYNNLNERQVQYINGFRFRQDFGADFFLAGPETARAAEKTALEAPHLLLVWCPGGNLVCFEHFRKTSDTPVHFLATHTLEGQLESIQFHPVLNDVSWYGKPLENVIVVAIAGQAGRTPETFQPDWLDFEEYSSLRRLLRNVLDQTLRKFFGAVEAEKLLSDPAFIRSVIKEFRPAVREEWAIQRPEGEPDLSLPYFWDSDLFWEVMESNRPPRAREQLLIAQPKIGKEYTTVDVPISLLLTEDVRLIEVYQDAPFAGPDAQPWERVIKREVNPSIRRKEEFTHPFTRPAALSGDHRAIKIVARGSGGELLSSQIMRFAVKGLRP